MVLPYVKNSHIKNNLTIMAKEKSEGTSVENTRKMLG